MFYSIDLTSASEAPIYFLLVERRLSDALEYAARVQALPDATDEARSAPLTSTVRPSGPRAELDEARPSSRVTLVMPSTPTLPAVAC